MGYIKKLKSNELIGGTDKTTIYPVTSTKAVFEEVTEGDKSSFKSQETINGEHDDRIKGLENEMPDTVKSITINGGTEHTVDESGNVDLTIYTVNPDDPDVPAMADLVEKNRDDIADIKEEIGTDTTENTLSGRIKSLETTVGTGGTVDSRIATTKAELEEQIAGKQKTLSVGAGITLTSDGVISATADPSVAKVVEALPTGDDIVNGLIYLVKTETAGTYSQHVHSTNGWSDDLPNVSLGITTDNAIDSTSTNPIQNNAITAQIGYFVCSASGSSAIKNVDAPSYSPSDVGGAFKIKMNYTNTCSDTVYLQFNSDSSTKKELKYNREPVTPTNTWDSTGDNKEVISVYYDGTCYQATNAQGGGGKAEKIKYDKTQSGLAAENVQEGLDKLNNRFKVYENDSSQNVSDRYISTGGTSLTGSGWMITPAASLRDKKGMYIHFFAEHKQLHDMLNYGLYTGTSLTTYIDGSGYQVLSAADAGWKTVSVDDLLEAYPNADNIRFTQTAVRLYPIYFSKSMKSVQNDIDSVNTDIDSLEEVVTIKEPSGSADTTINGFSILANTSAYAKSTVWDVLVFNVQEQYKSIEIQSNTGGSAIAFMNSYNIPEETGDAVGVYATGYTATILQPANTTETYDIPDDCNYILFAKRTSNDTSYPISIKFCYDVQTAINEIDTEIGGTYLDETMLAPGTTKNDTGEPVADSNNNCYRTGYLPVGDATEVIIYNDKVLNGRYISYKFSWYNANKEYKGSTGWTRVTTAQIPVNALGGYVRLVLSRNQNTTSTAADYAKYQLYLNIYGNDSLKKRVENIEDADYGSHISETDDILKGLAPRTFTLCTWNIGHFVHGQSSSSDIDSSNYDQKLSQFRSLIYNTINPRVIALNEYSAVFGKKPNNVNHNAKDVLFNDFGVNYEGSQNNYSCNALFGNTYLTNIQMCAYECLKDKEITHTTAIKATDYYYIIADLYMEGRLVKLVSTHLAFDTSEGRGGVLQSLQFDELISVLSGYDRAIIAGDMNLSADNPRYDVFVNAGYTLGNDGSITTHPGGSPSLDNIIYKGVVVSGISAITTSLSDHYPLVATITV